MTQESKLETPEDVLKFLIDNDGICYNVQCSLHKPSNVPRNVCNCPLCYGNDLCEGKLMKSRVLRIAKEKLQMLEKCKFLDSL